jgi:hypothetical protein
MATRLPVKGVNALSLVALGAAWLAGCPSVPPPGAGQPWSYGQSGNEAAQTATSPTDLQFICTGGSGTVLRDFLYDTSAPSNGVWTPLTVPLSSYSANQVTGTHVAAIAEASPDLPNTAIPLCTYDSCPFAGPLGLAAFWVDGSGTVWNAEQQGGTWFQPQEVGGTLQGGVEELGMPQDALRNPVGVAALQLNATTEIAYWVGEDQSVWMNTRGASGWSGSPIEIASSGSAVGTIDAVATSATQMDVVWIGPTGTIVDATWSGSPSYSFSISDVASGGASISGGVTAVAGGANSADFNVFWIAADGQVLQDVRDAATGAWLTAPIQVNAGEGPAALDSAVAAATTSSFGSSHAPAGRIYLTWADQSSSLLWTAYDDYDQVPVCRAGAPCQPPGWQLQSLVTNIPLSPNPLSIASRNPTTVDILYVQVDGSVEDATPAVPEAGFSQGDYVYEVASAENGCDPCGQGANGWACNGMCAAGTATEPPECGEGSGLSGCNPDGGNGICYPCYDACPSTSCCSQCGAVLQDSCFFNGQCCLCDSTIYPVPLNPSEFLEIDAAAKLYDFAATVADNELTVTVPPNLGLKPPPPTNISGELPSGVSVNTLTVPSPWNWTLDCNAMVASPAGGVCDNNTGPCLSATITGSMSGCSFTITITPTPVTIVLPIADMDLPLPGPGQLASNGASVPLVYNQNAFVSECLIGQVFGGIVGVTGQEVAGIVQQGLEQAIDGQLTSLLSAAPTVLSQLVSAAANGGVFMYGELNPQGQVIGMLPKTGVSSPTPGQFAWSCQALPGCQPGVYPADALLLNCTKECSDLEAAPTVGLGPGAPCLSDAECASDICNTASPAVPVSPPFLCCDAECMPPCSVCGLDGACHGTGVNGCP